MLLTAIALRVICLSWAAWELQVLGCDDSSPIRSLIYLLSWCALSFPSPLPLRCVPVSLWLCVPPSLPPSAAWGTDSASDKAASAAGRAKQYPGAHCSTAYAAKRGWRQPKGQAPKDLSAAVWVIMWRVCHLYLLPLPISVQRITLVFTHGWGFERVHHSSQLDPKM